MNKEGRTYFEAFEYGIGALAKRIASKVLPHAPLRTRIGLALLGVFLLLLSITVTSAALDMMSVYNSNMGLKKWIVYQLIIDVFLIYGSIALLLGKKLGWLIVTSFLILRLFPKVEGLISLLNSRVDENEITKSLFGFYFPEAGVIIVVLILLLVFIYSKSVLALYKINRRHKFIPVIAALLFASAGAVLNNFL